MTAELIDPNDPLATVPELVKCAIEVVDEIRFNVSDQTGKIPIIIDTDPEWLDASLDYIREVLDRIGEEFSVKEGAPQHET
jgi:hypothetical protein